MTFVGARARRELARAARQAGGLGLAAALTAPMARPQVYRAASTWSDTTLTHGGGSITR